MTCMSCLICLRYVEPLSTFSPFFLLLFHATHVIHPSSSRFDPPRWGFLGPLGILEVSLIGRHWSVCSPVVFAHFQCGHEPWNLDGANLDSCWCHQRARRFGQRHLSLPYAWQRWPESLFQTPTPLLFQNFWISVRQFFKIENPTPVQTPVTIINPSLIYPCFYLRNDHTDSCYCRNWLPNFWLRDRIRVRNKNAESCWSRLRYSRSGPTSDAWKAL